MATLQLKIPAHLLIPFGRPKWSIDRIKIVGVSTDATYLESDTPLVHIDKSQKSALRLRDVAKVFPEDLPETEDAAEAVQFIRNHLKTTCHLDTDSERRFLDLYFEFCLEAIAPKPWALRHYGKGRLPVPMDDPEWIFDALLPLPQAHLYLKNPLVDTYAFAPQNMVKVDFAFWTGESILAVEIDGASHIGSESHVHKDRMLQRAGVEVIHIMNSELLKHGKKVVESLFPKSVTHFWENPENRYRVNPLCNIPF